MIMSLNAVLEKIDSMLLVQLDAVTVQLSVSTFLSVIVIHQLNSKTMLQREFSN